MSDEERMSACPYASGAALLQRDITVSPGRLDKQSYSSVG